MDPPSSQDAAPSPVRFKASKKRKAYRQRLDGGRDSPRPHATPGSEAPPASSETHADGPGEDEETALAATIRLRNARRARLRGVAFASNPRASDDASADHALVRRGQEDGGVPAVRGIADRFTHQTGLIADLNDKHMNEYIESRLSSRNDPSGTSKQPDHRPAPLQGQPAEQAPPGSSDKLGDQPTKHGKLLEVDVPDNAWDRRDDAKRRRTEKPPKPRRGRNRRGSDDIKRDQLVEQFLHENKLDVYDVPSQSTAPASATHGDDLTADDRMAEQFRQQYLDEMAQRRQRRRPPPQPTRQQQPTGDVLKGPKLGGSRNQRAAVRDILLKQEKEKSGKRM
ncbi:hypothetical protein TOPH_00182 [Tolypocladium ophioglossoides CBS 100239]|uniref:mRNA splicing factor RNA helicase n=1 Tax=Tolypocladium ophioglossoides (strain CBS 100239) TaxID=1163406 RepID=A0A0L0NNV7_TOLOC|nr:hypothetical protein TOPH_00182 [Tolypocladium ophioglossoides CBS 100239]